MASELLTGEMIDLIGALEDSILLNWRFQNSETWNQFYKVIELPPPKDLRGVMEMIDYQMAWSDTIRACLSNDSKKRRRGENVN